jgi:hypothetical protein
MVTVCWRQEKILARKITEKLLEDFRLGWLDFELAADPLSKDASNVEYHQTRK